MRKYSLGFVSFANVIYVWVQSTPDITELWRAEFPLTRLHVSESLENKDMCAAKCFEIPSLFLVELFDTVLFHIYAHIFAFLVSRHVQRIF